MPFDPSTYPLEFKSTVEPIQAALVKLEVDTSTPSPIFILTFLSAQTPDNRLTPQFLTAVLSALQHVQQTFENDILSSSDYPQGAALVLTGQTSGPHSKFFSNGLDFESAISERGFFDKYLFPVYDKLMCYPMPVVASIGGHAFAAGFGLASSCDFAIMGKKGFLCMNEIDFGAQIPPGLQAPLSTRLILPSQKRRVVLLGERFPGAEALKSGFIDYHYPEADSAQVLKESLTLASKLAVKSKAGVWGENKKILYTEQLLVLRTPYELTLSKL